MSKLSVVEYSKALNSLNDALVLYRKSEQASSEQKAFRDACIQRFEYCIELSWKLSMKLLGSSTAAARPAIREMARSNLVTDPELWFTFIDARNNTSHSYDESVASEVFKKIEVFFEEAKKLENLLTKFV